MYDFSSELVGMGESWTPFISPKFPSNFQIERAEST